jgi:hypothetical protein
VVGIRCQFPVELRLLFIRVNVLVIENLIGVASERRIVVGSLDFTGVKISA